MIKKISVLFIAALMVIVITNNKTVYAAASDIQGPSVIHKEVDQVFTVGDLLNLYEQDVFIDQDGYTGYGNVPGEYTIVLIQGNITKDVTIKVVEEWGLLPNSNDVLFVADYKDIYVSNNRMLTLYQIIYYIYSETGYVDTNYQFRYEEIKNEYHYNFENGVISSGVYDFVFRLTYYSGEQGTYSAHINAIELPELPGIVLEPPPTTTERITKAAPFLLVCGVIVYYLIHKKKKRGYNL